MDQSVSTYVALRKTWQKAGGNSVGQLTSSCMYKQRLVTSDSRQTREEVGANATRPAVNS